MEQQKTHAAQTDTATRKEPVQQEQPTREENGVRYVYLNHVQKCTDASIVQAPLLQNLG